MKYKNKIMLLAYPVIGQMRPLHSNELIVSISWAVNSKSNTSKLVAMRFFVTDFGITMCPRCNW